MVRTFEGDTLVLATHNQGKVPEISRLLKEWVRHYRTAGELGLPEPEETEDTYAGNAILKARAAAMASGLPSLADDSGFSVTALNGAPGVYSARWAGMPRDFNRAMQLVHEKMGDNPDRSAAFICVLALAWPDGHVETFEGRIDGTMVWPPRGDKGFGYDPVFIPQGYDRTFAELDSVEKEKISHRSRAFAALVEGCFMPAAPKPHAGG